MCKKNDKYEVWVKLKGVVEQNLQWSKGFPWSPWKTLASLKTLSILCERNNTQGNFHCAPNSLASTASFGVQLMFQTKLPPSYGDVAAKNQFWQ